jgi:hypothetical protein
MVVFYIDEKAMEAKFAPVEPVYSTLKGISSAYSFYMLKGAGHVLSRRFSCWCHTCCSAFNAGTFDLVPHTSGQDCGRGQLTRFEPSQITCTAAAGIANARKRAVARWKTELKPKLKAGVIIAVQAVALWSEDERVHLRPGHFWLAELGDADGKGSPIMEEFSERQSLNGIRFDAGECALLIRHYYNRTPDDANGLTFVQWVEQAGERLIVNSTNVRAVEITLAAPDAPLQSLRPVRRPPARSSSGARLIVATAAATARDAPGQRFLLDERTDAEIRSKCEHS